VRTSTGSGALPTRTIRYSFDDKAHEIDLGGAKTRFWYGPDGQRYKREHGGKRTLYLGNVEIETVGAATTIKRTVAGVMLQTIVGSTATSHYLFHDHLGSLVKTTNASGTAIDSLDYRHFGHRRSYTNPATAVEITPTLTSRGFTGHEHVDAAGMQVIHMNGRIYDPALHRFLQADPVIQAPGNLQSWNAYTYVFNNPLVYTDPTGMISVKTLLRAVVGIVIAIYAPQFFMTYMKMTAFTATVAAGFVAGAVTTGSLQGGLIGAFSAGLFYGIGTGFENAGNWAKAAEGTGVWGTGLSSAGYAAKTLAHGMAGGVMSKLQGGKFGHGFVSAGVTQALSGKIDGIDPSNTGVSAKRVIAAALVGGATSAATGGKFANGAITAAFSRAFNDELHFDGKKLSWLDDDGKVVQQWDAVSGRTGATSEDQAVANFGPLPEGLWQVQQSEYQPIWTRSRSDVILGQFGRGAWPGGVDSWGAGRIWLHPYAGTVTHVRSGFSIHGGTTPGSAGCIDLTRHMTSFVTKFQSYGKDMVLRVKYAD
jgi:RHS repeat-associated protein